MTGRTDARPWDDLRISGLLWLINRVVFHPRGYALALVMRNGQVIGWELQGEGTAVWSFTQSADDEHFAAVQRTLAGRPPA